jgi:subtilisin family serine protease
LSRLRELALSLHHPALASRTGRSVSVAVVDSGINPTHPHIDGVADGVQITVDGEERSDSVDRLGHGTAVAAAIHEKAPDAVLYAVKVFEADLNASPRQLVFAMDWASNRGLRMINLSLGTSRLDREDLMRPAVEWATARGSIIVAAAIHEGRPWLPGCLPGVAQVALDWECPRDALRVTEGEDGEPVFLASGYPRPIPGVPPERNLRGVSFAVANVSGFLARIVEGHPHIRSPRDIVEAVASL